jgi:acyl dehydratase
VTDRNDSELWKEKWQPAIDAVGQDFSDGSVEWGADLVEPAILRRFVEPMEINTGIHTDEQAAREAGYDGIVAPSTATVLSLALPPMWSPGDEELYPDDSRDAQPSHSPINNEESSPAPETSGYFATDMEVDFLRPVTVGERLGRRGRRLTSCSVKQTSVGRGAFMTWEQEIVSDRGDVVARRRTGYYAFDPFPTAEDAPHNPEGSNR